MPPAAAEPRTISRDPSAMSTEPLEDRRKDGDHELGTGTGRRRAAVLRPRPPPSTPIGSRRSGWRRYPRLSGRRTTSTTASGCLAAQAAAVSAVPVGAAVVGNQHQHLPSRHVSWDPRQHRGDRRLSLVGDDDNRNGSTILTDRHRGRDVPSTGCPRQGVLGRPASDGCHAPEANGGVDRDEVGGADRAPMRRRCWDGLDRVDRSLLGLVSIGLALRVAFVIWSKDAVGFQEGDQSEYVSAATKLLHRATA